MNYGSERIILYIVWDATDSSDAAWAYDLGSRLKEALPGIVGNRLVGGEQPAIELVSGFENIPLPDDLGALSVVLLVLPAQERGFSPAAAARLRAMVEATSDAGFWEGRLLPIG